MRNSLRLLGHVDGIMGNSSAVFREPYDHEPGNRGMWRRWMLEGPGLAELIRAADSVGLVPQVTRSAISRSTHCSTFSNGPIERNGPGDHRFRVIHSQVLESDDFARFGELGLIAEVQPCHAIDDMRWIEERIGRERSTGAYAFKTLMEGGAIHAFTINNAYAAGEEDEKGSMTVGKLADFTVLDRDLLDIPPIEIKDARVLATIVGGRVVYAAPELQGLAEQVAQATMSQ